MHHRSIVGVVLLLASAAGRLLGVGTTIASGQQALLEIDDQSGSRETIGPPLPSTFGTIEHMTVLSAGSDLAALHFHYPNETSCVVLVSTVNGTMSPHGTQCFDMFHIYSLDFDSQSERLLLVAGEYGTPGSLGVYSFQIQRPQPQLVFPLDSASIFINSVAFSSKLNRLFVVSNRRPQMPTLLVLNTTLWKLSVISETTLQAWIATVNVDDSGKDAVIYGWIQNGFVRFPSLVTVDSKTGDVGPHLFTPVVGGMGIWVPGYPSVFSRSTEMIMGCFALYTSGTTTAPIFVTYNIRMKSNSTTVSDASAPFSYITSMAMA